VRKRDNGSKLKAIITFNQDSAQSAILDKLRPTAPWLAASSRAAISGSVEGAVDALYTPCSAPASRLSRTGEKNVPISYENAQMENDSTRILVRFGWLEGGELFLKRILGKTVRGGIKFGWYVSMNFTDCDTHSVFIFFTEESNAK